MGRPVMMIVVDCELACLLDPPTANSSFRRANLICGSSAAYKAGRPTGWLMAAT